jgi:hypothetical protein
VSSGEETENGRGSLCVCLLACVVLARWSPWGSRVFQRDNDPRRYVPC